MIFYQSKIDFEFSTLTYQNSIYWLAKSQFIYSWKFIQNLLTFRQSKNSNWNPSFRSMLLDSILHFLLCHCLHTNANKSIYLFGAKGTINRRPLLAYVIYILSTWGECGGNDGVTMVNPLSPKKNHHRMHTKNRRKQFQYLMPFSKEDVVTKTATQWKVSNKSWQIQS